MEILAKLDLADLDLDELDVTSLRDTVALPETGASSSGNCPQSGSCTHCKVT
jgi:thiazolylpeptide-type bacteriocin precursor